ncbi:MAG: hypothetical protein AB7F96_08170 [Beijerinckiaceae bacterium]
MLKYFSALATAALLGLPPAAEAQIQLPGANYRSAPASRPASAPAPSGSSRSRPRSGSHSSDGPPAAKPVKLDPPSEDTLAGKTLMHLGRRGSLRFEKAASGLALTQIKLGGDVISKPGETCEFEIPGGPYPVKFTGFAEGLRKYNVEVNSCPFSFTVLDGAIVATYGKATASTGLGAGTCQFEKKDCRGYLAGFWGPSGRSIGKSSYRLIEKARGKSEKDARANFRALLRAAQGNKQRVRDVAADQAGFSARREERCRDFLREHVHGFCASRVTEARAIQLGAKLNEMIKIRSAEYEHMKKEREAKRRNR